LKDSFTERYDNIALEENGRNELLGLKSSEAGVLESCMVLREDRELLSAVR